MKSHLRALGFSWTWILLLGAWPAAAQPHELAVLPAQPTSVDAVGLQVFGKFPGGDRFIPSPTQSRDNFLVRLDTKAVYPGVPMYFEPYEHRVLLGGLPPGHYRVEYFVEVFPAPIAPGAPEPPPDAVLEFDVQLASPVVPTLAGGALALLAAALAAGGILVLRRG